MLHCRDSAREVIDVLDESIGDIRMVSGLGRRTPRGAAAPAT
jgi:hypothetical protein